MSANWTADDVPDQSGRTVIVTGASSGLGLETSRVLAGKGARVVMAVRNEAKGRAAATEISNAHPGADLEVRRLDVGDLESVAAFATALGGPVDVLVNNAGIAPLYPSLDEVSEELFDKVIAVNLKGPFRLMATAGRRMAESGGGAKRSSASASLRRSGVSPASMISAPVST
jgi:NAD(P)-dependent dehydrogenase (short-subunit alcohol dehydrogenase family)